MPFTNPRPRHDPYVPAAHSSSTRRMRLRWLAAGGAVLAAGGIGAFAVTMGRAPAPPAADLDLDVVSVDPPVVDLGRVRLDVAVPVTVRLFNQSRKAVILGQATAETLEGC